MKRLTSDVEIAVLCSIEVIRRDREYLRQDIRERYVECLVSHTSVSESPISIFTFQVLLLEGLTMQTPPTSID